MNKEVKQLPYKETLSSLGLVSLERRKQSITKVCKIYKVMYKVYVELLFTKPHRTRWVSSNWNQQKVSLNQTIESTFFTQWIEDLQKLLATGCYGYK